MLNPIKKIMDANIKTKLMLMCLIVIVPVFCAGVYLLFSMVGILQESVVNEAFSDVDNLKTRLKDTIYTTASVAERIYYNNDINDLINNSFTTDEEYKQFYAEHKTIDEYLNAYNQIVDIRFYLDKEDFYFNSSFRKATNVIKASYWYNDAMENDSARWQVTKNPIDSSFYLSYVRKVYSNAGDPVGVMVIAISPEWIDGLMKDEVFSVIFSVQNGMVFYSNIDGYELGKVFVAPDVEPEPKVSRTVEIKSECHLTEIGYAVAAYFDYEDTGNLFQIYLVKPFDIVTGATKNITTGYVWYMAMCFILSLLITYLFSSFFARRIQFLRDQMHKVAQGDFELEEEIKGSDEINELYSDLSLMVKSMQQLINEAYEAKIQSETFKLNQMEAEFKTLASQINPHFLYNTLETIRMKAYCNNDKETADLVKKLGKFMRRCLEVKDGMVTLESELEFTKSYLELQSARFGDRVSYSIYCEVDTNYKILPLIIQPIVENAFVHGIESSKSNGHIDINVCYKSDTIVIDVIDNGQGIPDDKMSELRWKLTENDTSSGKSIGLTNVNKRIKMYHGEKYGLSVKSSVGKGTRIRITLPRYTDEKNMLTKELIARNIQQQ